MKLIIALSLLVTQTAFARPIDRETPESSTPTKVCAGVVSLAKNKELEVKGCAKEKAASRAKPAKPAKKEWLRRDL